MRSLETLRIAALFASTHLAAVSALSQPADQTRRSAVDAEEAMTPHWAESCFG